MPKVYAISTKAIVQKQNEKAASTRVTGFLVE